jgi:tetratricopeptide (TPR) repeat protein/tRNA A-37 threonylcarbamoyl transferase component Bud32
MADSDVSTRVGDESLPPLPPPVSAPAHLGQTPTAGPPVLGTLPPTRLGRYQVEGEIGRGGMGAVFLARDPALQRELAIKVLLEAAVGEEELRRRFLEEAQVGGQLQHPGVVPVHEVGDADGTPYFTMKLVRGRTLASLLRERTTPADDLARFVQIFEQVCQTMAYAHNKGVLHRDLKPHNIMVGAFGEVQVMDWGLAKVLHRGTAERTLVAAESAVQTARMQQDEAGSLPGAVLGTPAYMAPEQARGLTEQVDERSDVFGLGAILCEILIGRPPYRAEGHWALLRAAQADLREALSLLDMCGADAELVALAKTCLAAEPSQRPANAGAVAALVVAYRETVQDRLRKTELARATAQARAVSERRARRLTIGLATALLLAGAIGGGAYLWVARVRVEQAQAAAEAAQRQAIVEQLTDQDLRVAEIARREGDWSSAREHLERAAGRLGDRDVPELRERLRQGEDELALVTALHNIRMRRVPIANGEFEDLSPRTSYPKCFREHGLALDGDPQEFAARVRASPVREVLVEALDDFAMILSKTPPEEAPILVRAQLADTNESRREIRALLSRRASGELTRRAQEINPATASPTYLDLLADGIPDYTERARVMRRFLLYHPDDFWLNFDLARVLSQDAPSYADAPVGLWRTVSWRVSAARRRAEAVGYFRAARAARPRDVDVQVQFAGSLLAVGQLTEAQEAYRQALRLDSGWYETHSGLARAYGLQKRYEEAITSYREAQRLDPVNPSTARNLGLSLSLLDRLDDAAEEFEKAIALKADYGVAISDLAVTRYRQGRHADALRLYTRAVEVEPTLAVAHAGLAMTLVALGRHEEAIPSYQKAVWYKPEDAQAWYNLGVSLSARRRLAEAAEAYRTAAKLDPAKAITWYNLGNALWNQGLAEEAAPAYRHALALKPDYPRAAFNLGVVLLDLDDPAGAAAAFKQALDNHLNDVRVYRSLARALCCAGRFEESLAAYRSYHDIGSRQPGWQESSADLVRAAESLVDLDQRLPELLSNKALPESVPPLDVARVCYWKKRYAAAARFYSDAFAAEPMRADNGQLQDRYLAATAAALAGLGHGLDAGDLDDVERARLRRQAFDWLQAEVSARAGRLKGGVEVVTQRRFLDSLRRTPNLVGIREPGELARLPGPEARRWRRLWQEVDELVAQGQASGH